MEQSGESEKLVVIVLLLSPHFSLVGKILGFPCLGMAKTASGVVLLVPARGCSICMSAQCSATETNSSSRQMGSVRSRFKTCANAVYME